MSRLVTLCISLFITCLSPILHAADKNPYAGLTPLQVTAVKKVIHDYLLQNPTLLLEVSKKLQQQQQTKQDQESLKVIEQNKHSLFQDPLSPVAGNPRGSITLIEFFDYQCVHCREMSDIIAHAITQNKSLRVVFKDWPIFGGNSILAAKAAFAANVQGKYFPFHQALLSAQPPLDDARILQIAKKLKLNLVQFNKDRMNPKWAHVLKNNATLATSMHFVGTPTLIAGTSTGEQIKFIPGMVSADVLQDVIDSIKPTKANTSTKKGS